MLIAAASHDLECLRAEASLREAFKARSLARQTDVTMLLDDCRRALTELCTALEPAARSRAEELAPFARQLTETSAMAALDDRGLDAFLRPIFEEAGIGDRFVPPSVAQRAAAQGSSATAPPIELVHVALDAEALFDHLLTQKEIISYGFAYVAMLGPTVGPWRSLLHVPMVLQVARGTATRAFGNINVRLDSLIVNKKTRRPGGRHFKEHPEYAEEAWVEHFGRWSACDHAAADIHPGQLAAPDTEHLPTVAEAAGQIASIASGPVESALEVHDPPNDTAAMPLPGPALPGPALPRIYERVDVHGGPRPAPRVRRGLMLAATGRTVLRVALACIAAIVSGSLVGSAVASYIASPRVPDGESQVGSALALSDSFGSLPVGSDPGWETSGPGGVRVAPWPTSTDRSVRVQGGAADQSVSACRTIPPVRSGRLLAEARIFLDGFGRSDTTIASIRSGADEVAGLRIGPGGEILGPGDIRARGGAGAIAPNGWYQVSFDLDITSRTYGLAVWRSDPPTLVSERDGRWTRQLDGGIDRICFTTPGGVSAQSVYINELRVTAP
ncbi:MAG: hypothetical protein M3O91_07575 [Chloroflexota bacterium]|nr:hypothetical protein [Chloroflexota bacterium]